MLPVSFETTPGSGFIEPLRFQFIAGQIFRLSRVPVDVAALSSRAFDLVSGAASSGVLSQSCTSGGTLKAELQDRDGTQVVSPGDQITVTLDGCTEGGLLVTGGLQVSVNGIVSTGANRRAALAISLTSLLRVDNGVRSTVAGDVTCDCARGNDSDSLRVSGSKLELVDSTDTYRLLNYSNTYTGEYTQYLDELSVSGRLERESERVYADFSTQVPLYGRIGRPAEAGAVTVNGARNISIRLEEGAGGLPDLNGAEFQVDIDGDGKYDDWNAVFWSRLYADSLFAPVRPGISVPSNLPDPNEVFSRQLEFNPPAGNITIYQTVADSSRDRIYLSIPARNEVVALSSATYRVVYRVGVGSYPTAMALSGDGRKLYVALNQGGGVAELDLDSRQVSRFDTAAVTGSGHTANVIERDQNLYVTAVPGGQLDAYMGRIPVAGSKPAERIAGSEVVRFTSALAVDQKGEYLYLGTSSRLEKISLKDPGAPVVLSREIESIPISNALTQNFLSISPDGTRLLLNSGVILRTSDLTEIARLLKGNKAAYTADGKYILDVTVGGVQTVGGAFLYDADSLIIRRPLRIHCGFSQLATLTYVAARDQWLTAGNGQLCAFSISDRLHAPGEDAPSPALPIEPLPIDLAVTRLVSSSLADGPGRAVFDHARRFLYATGMEAGKPVLEIVDLASNALVYRGNIASNLFTSAIAVSDDGTRVYLLQSGSETPATTATSVVVFDASARVFLPALPVPNSLLALPGSTSEPFAHSMQMIPSNRLLITSGGGSYSQLGPVVALDVLTGSATRIAGGQAKFRVMAQPLLAADGKSVVLVDSNKGLQRIDLSRPDPDLVADRMDEELVHRQSQVSLSADGKVIYQNSPTPANVLAFDSQTFLLRGTTAPGVPIPSSDGAQLFVLDGNSNQLRVVDAKSFHLDAVYSVSGCGVGALVAWAPGFSARELILVRQDATCRLSIP